VPPDLAQNTRLLALHIALVVAARYHPRAMNWSALLNEDTWRFINTFAPWFSAIGTISAVVTSLYLAKKSGRVHLKVDAGVRTIIQQGIPSKDFVTIMVVNKGHRTATIQSVGWKLGFFRKTYFIQMPGPPILSSKLPQKLEDGESARYFFSIEPEGGDGWREQFKKALDKFKFPTLMAHSMKAQVHTSVGKTFEARIEKSLRDLLLTEKQAKVKRA
jgi:hypothetical protein